MNLLLARNHEIHAPGILHLRGARASHVRDVLEAVPGTEIRVGLPDGPQGIGRVMDCGDPVVIRHELDPSDEPETPALAIHVVAAVPRPKVLGRVLSHLAALGVASISLCRSWHVEKSYLSSDILGEEASRERLFQGLEQARDTRVPVLRIYPLFRPFVEDHLDALIPPENRLLMHPVGGERLGSSGPLTGNVTLAVGPERGWTEFECSLLQEHGFRPMHLGSRILRVETALTAALAQIQLLQQ